MAQQSKNDTLRVYKNKQRKIANQLGYSQEVILAIKNATSECQIDRIMVDARRKEMYNPYFSKQAN